MNLKQSIYEITKTLPNGMFGDETINLIEDRIWELIQSRERKAWDASAKNCKAYLEDEGLVVTVDGNFEAYLNSEEYLKDE